MLSCCSSHPHQRTYTEALADAAAAAAQTAKNAAATAVETVKEYTGTAAEKVQDTTTDARTPGRTAGNSHFGLPLPSHSSMPI